MAKQVIIRNGELIDYQTMIEEVVGMFLARNMNYKDYNDMNETQKDKAGRNRDARDRAWFIGDADYEIIVRKKRGSGNVL